MADNIQKEVQGILETAAQLALTNGNDYVTCEHLLYGVLKHKEFNKFLTEFTTVDMDEFISDITSYVAKMESTKPGGGDPERTAGVDRVFERAYATMMYSQRKIILPIDVFLSITAEQFSHAAYFIQKHGLEPRQLVQDYERHFHHKNKSTDDNGNMPAGKAQAIMEKYCTNLNELAKAKKIDKLIGREDELIEIAKTLSRKKKNNVIMIGDPGVGKTAVAEGLALNIINDNIPSTLKDHVVWSLEVGTLVAGAKYRGDFEERLKDVIDAAMVTPGTVLFIDEAHMMNGAGGGGAQGGPDFANMIKPSLAGGNLKVIAATTYEEYRKHFEKDGALMRRFNKVVIGEPTLDETYKIIMGLRTTYQNFHRMKIAKPAIQLAIKLSDKYISDKKLPDKAIDIIDAACAREKIRHKERPEEREYIEALHIYEEVSKMTRIPLDQLMLDQDEDKSKSLKQLEPNLKGKVFGQDEAIDQVLEKIYVSRAGLKAHDKPIASYLFTGPTGVGKTETAKQLAEELSMTLIRYDMSEYQEKHSVARLVGAPPGYVGHDSGSEVGGGLLISEVEKNPNCILLLDEVEKAHPDVTNILLQAMDNGFITSATGKKANLRNAIIIMTSNAGAAENDKNGIGFGQTFEREGEDDKAVKQFFPPEFRNRLDGIVKFNKLSKLNMRYVVLKFLGEANALLIDKKIKLVANEDVMDYLVEKGFDPHMGARPLARLINDKIKLPLSKLLLFGDIVPTDKVTKVKIEMLDGEIDFVYNSIIINNTPAAVKKAVKAIA